MYNVTLSPRQRERIARGNTQFLYTVACIGDAVTVYHQVVLKASNLYDSAKRIARQSTPGMRAYVVREVERV